MWGTGPLSSFTTTERRSLESQNTMEASLVLMGLTLMPFLITCRYAECRYAHYSPHHCASLVYNVVQKNGGIKGFPGAQSVDNGDELLCHECDILIPAAAEKAITRFVDSNGFVRVCSSIVVDFVLLTGIT